MLSLSGVRKTFNAGTVNERRALAGVDLNLDAGDFAVVIGSNGAGKSTLLNVLAGEVTPDAGSVAIDGRDLTGVAAHRRSGLIARVFQDPALGTAAELAVEENLAIADMRGRSRGLRRAVTGERLTRFRRELAVLGLGLEDRMRVRVDSLSGGQRQALALVMALLVVPKILILDEHTAALDPHTAAAVMAATVAAISRSKVTTLMVTHNMQHAIDYGNRLIMLDAGRVIYEAAGTEKAALTVPALVERFGLNRDEALLS